MSSNNSIPRTVAIIGGGPAGLMAAEILSKSQHTVNLYDAMPTVGRKFLMAGKGGMNITHSEPKDAFISRYGSRKNKIAPLLQTFDSEDLCSWIHGLGIETFIGSSGRIFPSDMKAAPLLRAWLHRLRESGVKFHMRHRWLGWNADGSLTFTNADGNKSSRADAVLLALGGGSWARLGSDGSWIMPLQKEGIAISPLKPSNCGFNVDWSDYFRTRFAGEPLKSVVISFTDNAGVEHRKKGECLITENGIEGSLIYALSAHLRDSISANREVTIYLDLLPDRNPHHVISEVCQPRGSKSTSTHLQSRLNIKGLKIGLLYEVLSKEDFLNPVKLGATVKKLPLRLTSTRPIDEAISTAGGVEFEELDEKLMLRKRPGVFCAGEMLDWEAPTGGYLLTACFASGRVAGQGVVEWLENL